MDIKNIDETRIIYHVDDEDTPYSIKIPISPDRVTLSAFKTFLSLPKPSYKYFFKSMDADFGVVKEEITDDDAKLPIFRGRVVSWLVSAEGSNLSDGSAASQLTEIDNGGHHGSRGHHLGDRLAVIGDSRPSSFHPMSGDLSSHCGETTCTETESMISSRRGRRYTKHGSRHTDNHHHHHHHCGCDTSTAMTSDMDTTSFLDSDEDFDEDETTSRISTTTDETSVSRVHPSRHRRRRRRHRMPAMSHTSSISSITDSTMSLNIITVTLNLDTVNFLGISIVGQSNKNGDGGIYVGSIMKGGAVALDGRIEPGDMILQVNDVNFENMSNDEAVRVLREAVQKPGPIKLVVAKCWDPNPKGYFTIPRSEPVRPIDPGAWVVHTEAARAASEYPMRPPSVSTLTSTSSSITSSIPEADRIQIDQSVMLSVDMEMLTVTNAMAVHDSGLDVRDRMWLKITIPKAFLGSDVVEWLYSRVQGFQDRREAKKYANQMLKQGFIKHTVNKSSFSEQCYYIFGDMIQCSTAMSNLAIDDEGDLEPLPPPPSGNNLSPWHGPAHMPQYTGNYIQPATHFMPWGSEMINYGIFGAQNEGSMHSGSGGSNGVNDFNRFRGNDHLSSSSPNPSTDVDQTSQRSGPFPLTTFQPQHSLQNKVPFPPQPLPRGSSLLPSAPHDHQMSQSPAFMNNQTNGIVDNGSNSSTDHSSTTTQTTRDSTIGVNDQRIDIQGSHQQQPPSGQLDDVASDMTGSRKSFKMAMVNPCEFFVDVM